MAKSNLTYTRKLTDKIQVKGVLSDDGAAITYLNEDKEEQVISVADCLSMFKGDEIVFSVAVTEDRDLNINASDE